MNTSEREKLSALLEAYGGSLKSFQELPANSYEQQLAGQSLERLEQLYAELFKSGQTLDQTREKSPPWPPRSKLAGELPSTKTLSKIAERFNTEMALSGIGAVSAFLKNFRTELKATPLGDNDQIVDAVIGLAGQELLSAKQQGVPIAANLPVVDRLQYQQRTAAKLREIATREKAINLLVKKYEDDRERSKKVLTDDALTPEQKLQRQREILGIT